MKMKHFEQEPDTLWEYITYLRQKAGYKMSEFADKIGCSFTHAQRIEKPFHYARTAPSGRLLKIIASVCTKDEEEMQVVERKLLLRRARLFYSTEILQNNLENLSGTDVSQAYGLKLQSQSMPAEFIERFRQDTAHIHEDMIIGKLLIEKEVLGAVLNGTLSLSAEKVSELAQKLRQPADEYLVLAGYMPEGLRELAHRKAFRELVNTSKRLRKDDCEKLWAAIDEIVSLVNQLTKKKGSI